MQQDIFNTTVSWYEGMRNPYDPSEHMDTTGHTCTLREFLASGEQWKSTIDEIRRIRQWRDGITDEEQHEEWKRRHEVYKKSKKKLPTVAVSGVFRHRSKDPSALISATNIVCIDVDAADNPQIANWPEFIHNDLSRLPYIFYASLSVGGTGAFAFMAVEYPKNMPSECTTSDKHDFLYSRIRQEFADDYGIVLDKTSYINALRFLSYDDNPYYCYNPTPYTAIWEPEPERTPSKAQNYEFKNYRHDGKYNWLTRDDAIENICSEMAAKGTDYAPTRNDWVAFAAAFKREYNGSNKGLQLFRSVVCSSSHNAGYEDDAWIYNNVKIEHHKKASMGSVIHLACIDGIEAATTYSRKWRNEMRTQKERYNIQIRATSKVQQIFNLWDLAQQQEQQTPTPPTEGDTIIVALNPQQRLKALRDRNPAIDLLADRLRLEVDDTPSLADNPDKVQQMLESDDTIERCKALLFEGTHNAI